MGTAVSPLAPYGLSANLPIGGTNPPLKKTGGAAPPPREAVAIEVVFRLLGALLSPGWFAGANDADEHEPTALTCLAKGDSEEPMILRLEPIQHRHLATAQTAQTAHDRHQSCRSHHPVDHGLTA